MASLRILTLDRARAPGRCPSWDSRLIAGNGTLWDAAIGRGVLSLGWPTTVRRAHRTGRPRRRVIRLGSQLPAIRSAPARARRYFVNSNRSRHRGSFEWSEEVRAAGGAPSRLLANARPKRMRPSSSCRLPGRASSERDPGLWLLRLNQTDPISRGRTGFRVSVEDDEALARVDDGNRHASCDCLELDGAAGEETAIFVTRRHRLSSRFTPPIASECGARAKAG